MSKSQMWVKYPITTYFRVTCDGIVVDAHDNFYDTEMKAQEALDTEWTHFAGSVYGIRKFTEQDIYIILVV